MLLLCLAQHHPTTNGSQLSVLKRTESVATATIRPTASPSTFPTSGTHAPGAVTTHVNPFGHYIAQVNKFLRSLSLAAENPTLDLLLRTAMSSVQSFQHSLWQITSDCTQSLSITVHDTIRYLGSAMDLEQEAQAASRLNDASNSESNALSLGHVFSQQQQQQQQQQASKAEIAHRAGMSLDHVPLPAQMLAPLVRGLVQVKANSDVIPMLVWDGVTSKVKSGIQAPASWAGKHASALGRYVVRWVAKFAVFVVFWGSFLCAVKQLAGEMVGAKQKARFWVVVMLVVGLGLSASWILFFGIG
ncbi:MAG: hypothetical protein Q9169_007340 [Polycauliona sp. 2 TL-2023]